MKGITGAFGFQSSSRVLLQIGKSKEGIVTGTCSMGCYQKAKSEQDNECDLQALKEE